MNKKNLLKRFQFKKKGKPSGLERFILFLVLVGGVLIVFFIGRLLYSNLAPHSNLSDYLPGDKTVAYVEWKDLKLPESLQSDYPPQALGTFIGGLFEFDLQAAMEEFGTGQIAYALLETTEGKNEPLILVETKNKSIALSYFKSLLLDGEELESTKDLNPIYNFPQGQNFEFKFLGRYVAISPEKELLELLGVPEAESLTEENSYQSSLNHLPRNPWLIAYIDVQKVTFTKQPQLRQVIEPLKFTANHLSFAVRKSNEGFQFNSYLNLKDGLLNLEEVNEGEKFKHELTQYIPKENLVFYVGGSNLEVEWQNTLETLSNLNPAYALILEGMLRAQSEDIFGGNIDLRNDLYPLFENEYAFVMGKNEDVNEIGLILRHDDEEFAKVKMEKMAKGFEMIAASFAPKVNTVTLPDGTISRELVPDESKVESGTSDVAGNEVVCTEIRGDSLGFCYAVTEKMVLMANNKTFIENALIQKEDSMLADDIDFKANTKKLSQINDEMTFIRFEKLNELLPSNIYLDALTPFIQKMESSAWTKHYFKNAATLEGVLTIK